MARSMIVLAALMVSLVPAVNAADPRDVADYVNRRLGCNHWADEDGYDAERRAQIGRAVAKLRCGSLDLDERALRYRYRHNPEVLRQIEKRRVSYPD